MNPIYQPRRTPNGVFHEVRGVSYHVYEWGLDDSSLVVLLHGWGDCGATFQYLVDYLGTDRPIVAPDWRGFGLSGHSGPAYWFPDYIADLDALLSIYSPDRAVTLVGHSMGGNVAALFAGIFPERVTHLVNVEGFGLRRRSPEEAPANFRRWIEQARNPLAYTRFESFTALADKIRRRSPNMTREYAEFVARAWGRDTGDAIEIRADPAHKLPNAVLYRRSESRHCWRQIEAKTLVVAGADSDFREAAEAWPDPEADTDPPGALSRVIIPDCGHMAHFEQPQELARAVEAFLEGS